MKKNFKIVSLVLSMLLIVGAVVGISVSASDPAIEITSKNVSYEGAVKTVYIVETENADGYTVKVNFYDTDPANGGEALYSKGIGNTVTLGEVEYDVVFSNGFAPNQLRNSIFAVPTLVDANGAVVATGATVEYSPYTYAMNRFSQNPTADQLALYTALLDYGAAVQRVLNTPDEVKALGGYADEYYEIDAKYTLAHDMSTKYKLKAGTFSKASIDAGKIIAGDTYDVYGFAAWANAEGDIISLGNQQLTSNDVAPGKNTLLALYGRYDTVNTKASDFANGNPSSFISNTHNVATVGNNINTQYAYADKPGFSSVIDADGVVTYTKVNNPRENFETDKEYKDANYQWIRTWVNLAESDVYVAEIDLKFENVSGEGNYQLGIEGWRNGYTSFRDVIINPSDEKDENGYSTYFTLGNAKLDAGETYTIRLEWYRDADVMIAYVNGARAYTYKATTPVDYDTLFQSFKIIGDSMLEGVVTLDNFSFSTVCLHNNHSADILADGSYFGSGYFKMICDDCGIANSDLLYEAANVRGSGVYYNDATSAGTRYDMSAIPSRHYKRANQTWEIIDSALQITSHDWSPMSIRPVEGTLTATAGQKFVVEFDLMYGGSDNSGDSNHYVFSGLAGAEVCSNTAQSPAFYWGSSSSEQMSLKSGIYLANSVWYNYRFEYTINEDGSASYVTYVNNEVIDDLCGTVTTAITTCFGWSICGRVSGNSKINLDNMYIGVTCAEHTFVENGTNVDAYVGDGVFYKSCEDCGKIDTANTFTLNDYGKGEYYTSPDFTSGKADVENTAPIVTVGKMDQNGLVHGASNGNYNVTCVRWSYLTLASSTSVNLAAGEKFVQEFNFMYAGSTEHPTDKDGRVYAGLSTNASGSNSALASSASDSIYTTADYAWIALDKNESTNVAVNNKTPLLLGTWYTVRAEYTISEDGSSAYYAIYINGELESYVTDSTPNTTIVGWLMQPSRQANETLDFKFDNFFMSKVCTTHDYVDTAPTAATYAGDNENGSATFYSQACTKCGKGGGEIFEYAGVELGTGTYYADETKEGRRQDYSNVNVGTGFTEALNGTNAPATKDLYSIKSYGDNKTLNLNASAWSTAAVRPFDANKINVATGDKLIMEFDLRVDATYHADTVAAKLNFASTYKSSDSKQISDQIALKSTATGDSILGNTTLTKGVWYNVRFELTVNGNLEIYVNNELSATMTGYTIPDGVALEWNGLGIVTRGTTNISIDNMYMGHFPAAN